MANQTLRKIKRAITKRYHQRFGVMPLIDSQASIQQWFDSPLGERVLAAEQNCINQVMPSVYGYHLMQLSVLNRITLSEFSPASHHFSLGINTESGAAAVSHFEQLPIDSESIDGAILHHVLEYSTNPHQLLRETARTIIPNGHIVILGFNPNGVLAIKQKIGRLLSLAAHWRYHNLRRRRLEDWLRVLDFEPVFIQHGYHGLPMNNGYRRWLDHACGRVLPGCGLFYMIVARKSITPMTLVKPNWKKVSPIASWAKGSAIPHGSIIHRSEHSQESHHENS